MQRRRRAEGVVEVDRPHLGGLRPVEASEDKDYRKGLPTRRGDERNPSMEYQQRMSFPRPTHPSRPATPWARTSILVAIACAALATLPMSGCGSTTEGGTDDTTAASTAATVTAPDRAAPGEIAPDATDRQGTASDESLNDAQILGVVKIANESEVATGQLAVQKSMTPEVRDYAQDIVQDHLAAGQHVDQTATAAPPSGSQLATAMVEDANEK